MITIGVLNDAITIALNIIFWRVDAQHFLAFSISFHVVYTIQFTKVNQEVKMKAPFNSNHIVKVSLYPFDVKRNI